MIIMANLGELRNSCGVCILPYTPSEQTASCLAAHSTAPSLDCHRPYDSNDDYCCVLHVTNMLIKSLRSPRQQLLRSHYGMRARYNADVNALEMRTSYKDRARCLLFDLLQKKARRLSICRSKTIITFFNNQRVAKFIKTFSTVDVHTRTRPFDAVAAHSSCTV
uniref:Uncharacterized protein n=1 Tax=Trichogramma kaykai TaxID=54128 RepID=A0ABD2WV11_9HYME